jgi:hypothetical protein
MKHSLMRCGPLIAMLSMMAPCVLRSAEPANQIPPSAAVGTNQNVQSNELIPPPKQDVIVTRKIVYKPPLRGAPAVRIDGGSRGSGVSLIALNVLAPDHTGLTVQEQPSLFWYQSELADVPFVLTLLVDKQAKPVLEVKLPDAKRAGIQRLKLSDYRVTLSPGVEYEWVVALVVDPESRSKDVVASGSIQRVEPSAGLSARLANSSKTDRPYIYAEEGIWYDALAELSNLLETQPDNASLRAERAALLEQGGITNAATYAGGLVRGK